METFWYRLTQVHLEMVWYGIVEFNVPLDTVYVISEMGSTWKMVIKMETALNPEEAKDTERLHTCPPHKSVSCCYTTGTLLLYDYSSSSQC